MAIKDILLIQADDDYTLTITDKGSFTTSIRLNELEELVAAEHDLAEERVETISLREQRGQKSDL